MSSLIRFPDEPHEEGLAAAIGEKAVVLSRAAAHGISVPSWFVVTSKAFEGGLSSALATHLLQAEQISATAEAVARNVLPSIESELQNALKSIGLDRDIVAIRPSFDAEDWRQIPAGVRPGVCLSVRPSDTALAIANIWKLAFSDRVLQYRRAHGLPLVPKAPAIIVQKMLHPEAAGEAFGVDLVTGQQSVTVVAAVFGLSTSLASGESPVDLYRVGAGRGILSRDIADKRLRHEPNANCEGGVASLFVSIMDRTAPCLSDEQVQDVNELACRVQEFQGRPQEIEWAIEGQRLWLLGSRAISGLGSIPDPDAPLVYWDSSVLAEFFPNITTPLTVSLVRRAAPSIVRALCRSLRAPAEQMDAVDPYLDYLIGCLRGRMLCNVRHLYRIFAMLPDYPANVRYFGRIAGISAGLPEDEEAKLRPSWLERIGLIERAVVMAVHWLGLGGTIAKFEERVDEALSAGATSLTRARPDELVNAFVALERRVLAAWDAPVLNDFFTMVSWALLVHAAHRWCADASEALVNDLMTGRSAKTEDDPREALRDLAHQIRGEIILPELLLKGSSDEIRRCLQSRSGLSEKIEKIVERYSDCALAELKIESLDFQADPTPIYRALGRAASASSGWVPADLDVRGQAELFVLDAIGGQPIRNTIFQWLVKQTLARMEDRIRLACVRRRVVRRVRSILIEIGRRYYSLGLLERPEDILFLEIEEILGCANGAVFSEDPGALAASRRSQYDLFTHEEFTPSHIEHRGPAILAEFTRPARRSADGQRQGIGCCKGVVRGRARLADADNGSQFEPGDILVASSPDASWLLLYPTCGGMLLGSGGQLSFGVVRARSLGVPTVIISSGLTSWLSDGDLVEMNGSTGVVTRIREEPADMSTESNTHSS